MTQFWVNFYKCHKRKKNKQIKEPYNRKHSTLKCYFEIMDNTDKAPAREMYQKEKKGYATQHTTA